MYQTSQEYKDLMKRPVRNQSFMKVQLGLINQDAQQSAELQDQEKYNGFSDPTSLYSQHTVKDMRPMKKICFELMVECTFFREVKMIIQKMELHRRISLLEHLV